MPEDWDDEPGMSSLKETDVMVDAHVLCSPTLADLDGDGNTELARGRGPPPPLFLPRRDLLPWEVGWFSPHEDLSFALVFPQIVAVSWFFDKEQYEARRAPSCSPCLLTTP